MNAYTLYTRMPRPMQDRILASVNASQISMGNKPITSIADLGNIASHILNNDPTFQALSQNLYTQLIRKAESYKNPDSKAYAVAYVKHIIRGRAHPQAISITVNHAANIRNRICKALETMK